MLTLCLIYFKYFPFLLKEIRHKTDTVKSMWNTIRFPLTPVHRFPLSEELLSRISLFLSYSCFHAFNLQCMFLKINGCIPIRF